MIRCRTSGEVRKVKQKILAAYRDHHDIDRILTLRMFGRYRLQRTDVEDTLREHYICIIPTDETHDG